MNYFCHFLYHLNMIEFDKLELQTKNKPLNDLNTFWSHIFVHELLRAKYSCK